MTKIEVSEATYQLILEAQKKKGLSSLSVTLAELALEFLRKKDEKEGCENMSCGLIWFLRLPCLWRFGCWFCPSEEELRDMLPLLNKIYFMINEKNDDMRKFVQ